MLFSYSGDKSTVDESEVKLYFYSDFRPLSINQQDASVVESSEPEDHRVFSIDDGLQSQRLVESQTEKDAGPEQRIMGRMRRRWHLYRSLCSPLKQLQHFSSDMFLK